MPAKSPSKAKPSAAAKRASATAKPATKAPAPSVTKASAKAAASRKPSGKTVKPSVIVQASRPTPAKKGKKVAPVKTAKQILKEAPKIKQEAIADSDRFQPPILKIKDLFGSLEFFDQKGKKTKLSHDSYDDMFLPEIEAELAREATIYNDRVAHWRCQCCDAILTIPRRTSVIHGDYELIHDDKRGLLVNQEKFVPLAETPIEVHQPGRLRDPWTGETLGGPRVKSS